MHRLSRCVLPRVPTVYSDVLIVPARDPFRFFFYWLRRNSLPFCKDTLISDTCKRFEDRESISPLENWTTILKTNLTIFRKIYSLAGKRRAWPAATISIWYFSSQAWSQRKQQRKTEIPEGPKISPQIWASFSLKRKKPFSYKGPLT